LNDSTVVRQAPTVELRMEGQRWVIQDDVETRKLNDVGATIWSLCNGRRSIGEIADRITVEFEVSAEIAQRDCREFVLDLVDQGFLLPVE